MEQFYADVTLDDSLLSAFFSLFNRVQYNNKRAKVKILAQFKRNGLQLRAPF